MFENIEGKNAIKTRVAKGKMVSVAHYISVFENLVLKFDAIRIFLRGRTGTDMQDKFIALPEDCFEISADWVGYVVGRNDGYVFLHEKGHFILNSIGDVARFALQPGSSETQSAAAGGTTDNTGNALIHSTKPMVCTTG
jgi:hypothetical protein